MATQLKAITCSVFAEELWLEDFGPTLIS